MNDVTVNLTNIPYDALSTFLIFLIGVPALVIQSMSDEVRQVVLRRWRLLLVETSLPVIAAAILVGVALAARPSWGADETLWIIVLASLFLISIITAIYMLNRYGRKDAVSRDLERQITKRLPNEARLVEEPLQAMIELGGQSAPGEDKQLVLQALSELTVQVCRTPTYRGDSLETLIAGLADILVSDSATGDSKNFRTAVGILHNIIMTPPALTDSQVDLVHAVRTLSGLARATLSHIEHPLDVEQTLMNCIEALGSAARRDLGATTEVSQVLLEIGIAAIEHKQTLAAIAALNQLFVLVDANQPARGELVADALGLASHFWVDGETARKYVEEKLKQTQGELAENLCDALKAARHHCMITTKFQTADNLQKMTRDHCN